MLLGSAIALGIWSEAVRFRWDEPARWVPDLLTGCTLIVCGGIAVSRRPGNRTGVLLAGSGVLWFVPNLASLGGLVGALAARSLFLHRAPLMHAVLTFPNGKAPSRLVQGAIVVLYLASVMPAAWNAEVVTLALALGFVVVSAATYARSVGAARRVRLISLEVAVLLGGTIAVGAITRLVTDRTSVDPLLLLTYESTLVVAGLGLVGGLLSRSAERAAVTDLVVELGEARSGTLRGELSRALGDPSLEVGFWDPERGEFIDHEGVALELPAEGSSRSVTIVRREEEPLAALLCDPAVLDDPGLVEAVTAAARLHASNSRLRADVQARVRELEASRRRLVDAADEERRQLERRLREGAELHLQNLDQLLDRAGAASEADPTRTQVAGAHRQLQQALEDLSRLASGLHPRALSELGLAGALEALASGLPMPVDLQVDAAMRDDAELVAYFVCSEALSNVVKYAGASHVTIAVRRHHDRAVVEIADDGVGGADMARGSGLRGLADRVETFGGALTLRSEIGRGTRLIADLPLGDEETPGVG